MSEAVVPPAKHAILFEPLKLGSGVVTVSNRIHMAALTRNRAVPTTIPNEIMKEHYLQRSEAGLIVTEAIPVEEVGSEWPNAPCINTEEHIVAWKDIVDAMHEKGTSFFAQLWHPGRVCHPDMPLQKGKPVIGPSAIGARNKKKFRLLPGYPGYVTPTAIDDPQVIVDMFKQSAINAKAAGFDGVEVHGANGYLLHAFIDSSSNHRTDAWGGSPEKRAKITLEILKACVDVWGPGRVGVKFSPCGGYNDMGMPIEETLETYSYLLSEADKLPLAFIVLMRWNEYFQAVYDGVPRATPHDVLESYRKDIKNVPLILNCGMLPDESAELIAAGKIDAVQIGIPFVANPDLVKRVRYGKALSWALDMKKIYGFGPDVPLEEQRVGYNDYPVAEY